MWRLLRFLSRRISGIFLFIWIAISLFIYLIHLSSISSIHQAHSGKTVGSSSSIQLQKLYLPTIIQEDTPQSCHYPLPYYKPSMKSVDSYKSINLVFYKKHKMSAAVGVARKRGWHTVRVARSYDDLISYISDDSFTIIFTSSKELSLFLLEQFVNQSNILALGIPGAYLFTGPKKEQFITYQAYLNKHGCSIESIKMMPSMFLLDDNAQCETFFNQLKTNNSNKKWILKNSRGYGGDQIQVIHNTTSLASRFGSCNNNRPFIIQEYIQDLLLLDNRKFDIRALIVIGSARPYMVFYHEGYLRVVIRPYDPEGSRDIHLSNTHVQALQPDFTPDKHFWSFDRFQEYLNDHHPDNNDFVHTKLIPYIKQVSLTVIKSGMYMYVQIHSKK